MCLIAFAWRVDPSRPLIMIANRDEFYQRPTSASEFWPEQPEILAGRDLQAGGSWMGVHGAGRFAAVTNVREVSEEGQLSRGDLVMNYLREGILPSQDQLVNYAPFNLLYMSHGELGYLNNLGVQHNLLPGLYVLTNSYLNTPWPKARQLLLELELYLLGKHSSADLLDCMQSRQQYPEDWLPDTGFSLEQEKLWSACFIQSDDYGTRSTTLLELEQEQGSWLEISYDGYGQEQSRQQYQFQTGSKWL